VCDTLCVCVFVCAGRVHEEARTLCEEIREANVNQNKTKQNKTGKLHEDARTPCEEIGEANVHRNL
jgi:hypothetical protein